jgi:nicotinamide mononucleotide transporter
MNQVEHVRWIREVISKINPFYDREMLLFFAFVFLLPGWQESSGNLTFVAMDFNAIIDLGPVQTSLVELIAVFFGLLSVWNMKKENILVYPFGIINVAIYVYICYSSKLYAYAGINVFYAFMSIYGWYSWTTRDNNDKPIRITSLSWKQYILCALAILALFVILRLLLVNYTDSKLPSLDAFTTGIYIIAMLLLAFKKIEHWILWITGDVISIGLFAYENLYFSSIQFLIFTIIAVLGFLEWRIKLIK